MGPQLPTAIACSLMHLVLTFSLLRVSISQSLLPGANSKVNHIQMLVLRSAFRGSQAKTVPVEITCQLRIVANQARPLTHLGCNVIEAPWAWHYWGQGAHKSLVG